MFCRPLRAGCILSTILRCAQDDGLVHCERSARLEEAERDLPINGCPQVPQTLERFVSERIVASPVLDCDRCPGGEPRKRIDPLEEHLIAIEPVGWIGVDEVDRSSRLQPLETRKDIGGDHAQRDVPFLRNLRESLRGRRNRFDRDGGRRPAGDCFEREDSAAREQIEKNRVRHLQCDDVEECLARALGSRPQIMAGNADFPAPKLSSGDAKSLHQTPATRSSRIRLWVGPRTDEVIVKILRGDEHARRIAQADELDVLPILHHTRDAVRLLIVGDKPVSHLRNVAGHGVRDVAVARERAEEVLQNGSVLLEVLGKKRGRIE